MATTYKILGQVIPAATTETQLYQPSGAAAVVSTIVICNQASAAATYRIAVTTTTTAGTGAVAGTKDWIVYGATVAASDSTALTLGITLASTNQIRVYSSTATLSFNAFGSEVA